jgi:hypothetical protein
MAHGLGMVSMHVTVALKKLKQEIQEFKANMCYMRSRLKMQTKKFQHEFQRGQTILKPYQDLTSLFFSGIGV